LPNDTDIDDDLERLEEEQASADESDETPPTDIVAFNELRSCADLFRLYEAGQLDVQPEYQRDVVWSASSQTRFIDSLAKQLPIPSMCISLDYKTDKRQVVDGLQRMSSIVRFLSDKSWRLSNLDDIDRRIANKTVEFVKRDYPTIYSRIENTTIPVTVLRCDLSKRNHQEYLFTIFHRLNTGGLKLTNQEIRNCIYSGDFNSMLKRIVLNRLFVQVFSIDSLKKYRFSNEELVLRILSFAESHENYKGPLSKHLNAFMATFRIGKLEEMLALESLFERALELVYAKVLKEEPLPRLSKATIEALFVAVLRNWTTCSVLSAANLQLRYEQLRNDVLFSVESLKEGLAAPDRVKARLDRAIIIFS
jgi:hypothetical protein